MMAKKAPNPIDKHVGSRVRMRRMMLSMSQEKLGDALGLTFQQVQKYEKGTNRIGASRLQQISHILQVPVAFFFEGAPNLHGSADGGTGDGREHLASSAVPRFAHTLTACGDAATNTPAQEPRGVAIEPARGVSSVSHANYLFTSESVSEGHPDKVCDQISDAILDAFIENDIKLGIADDSLVNTRLGCETLCTTNKIVIAGQGRGQAPLFSKYGDHAVVNRELISQIARNVVRDIGYDQNGFSYHGADIEVLLHGQSPDIAMGVDAKKKKGEEQEGAGDQGMMFGFACTESEVYEKGSFMPAPIYFAHKILKVLAEKRRSKQLCDLQPDAKSQVTVQYAGGKPIGCTKVVVSTQHNPETRNGKKYTPSMVKEMIGDAVASALPDGWMPKRSSDFLVNPTGNFVVGGPDRDCGLTGRKIIVDTYGGYAPHGGG